MKKKIPQARRTKAELKSNLPPISLFVRNRREELGYTQEELASRSGVSVRFLKEFERGKPTARLDKISELLDFLGAELSVADKAKK
jgi:y4mF family transcriptional regulator